MTRRIYKILLGLSYGCSVLLNQATMLQVEIGWRLLESV